MLHVLVEAIRAQQKLVVDPNPRRRGRPCFAVAATTVPRVVLAVSVMTVMVAVAMAMTVVLVGAVLAATGSGLVTRPNQYANGGWGLEKERKRSRARTTVDSLWLEDLGSVPAWLACVRVGVWRQLDAAGI
jgi:hypothetical protein